MPKYRDAEKAIEYATKACELKQWKDAQSFETLAAAYAEAGQFDDAVKSQMKVAEIDPKAADAKRLALYQQKQPFRDSNRKDESVINVSNLQNKVVINLGQKSATHFQFERDQLVEPKTVQADGQKPAKLPDCLWLDFRQDKRGRILFLWHSFKRTIRAKCVARLKDYDTYFDTDLVPVPEKTVSPEIWKEPIEELVLFDLTLE
jgi:tetratricopeptide (TPR) repeat protein